VRFIAYTVNSTESADHRKTAGKLGMSVSLSEIAPRDGTRRIMELDVWILGAQ
jgi:hypothetical protein